MIAKGNQRSGGQNLATHLMNAFDNERVEIADLRGAVMHDLHGAFAEWRAHSKATRCKEYLYSLSINPDDKQGNLTREQYLDFIARAEVKLKLSDQARAVVFHTKEGRLHAHVVWSRIDLEKLKAVQMSKDRLKLRSVAQGFARDYGLDLPEGMKNNNRGLERFNDHAKDVNLTEKQQQDRTGETKADRMAVIGDAWRSSDNGPAFVQALKALGFRTRTRRQGGDLCRRRPSRRSSSAAPADRRHQEKRSRRTPEGFPARHPARHRGRPAENQRGARTGPESPRGTRARTGPRD
jgi:hypothetical protein